MFRQLLFIAALVAISVASPVAEERGGRIVGGFPALARQFPHQVSLRNTLNVHFCGGSIVNSRWILSSAHCKLKRFIAEVLKY